jgi:uncharacterized protein YecT (DUF1311 family)
MRRLWVWVVLCPAVMIHAQDKVKDCDRANLTQSELNECASDRAAVVDQQLSQVYRSLLKSVSGDKALTMQIEASERHWIRYRDSYLRAAFPSSGPHADNGSMLPMEFDELRVELTQEQIQRLSYLKHLYTGN